MRKEALLLSCHAVLPRQKASCHTPCQRRMHFEACFDPAGAVWVKDVDYVCLGTYDLRPRNATGTPENLCIANKHFAQ